MSTMMGKFLKAFTYTSSKYITLLEERYGWYCDVYFPINSANPDVNGNYDNVNLFGPHGTVAYSNTPNISQVKFMIPKLLKKEIVSTLEEEFSSFYNDGDEQAYIWTTHAKEIPTGSKVIVDIEGTKMYFEKEKTTGCPGAYGYLSIRMYLNPLAGEN